MKQNDARRARNRSRRSALKSQIRKFLEAVRDNDTAQATEHYRATSKLLDQNAAKGTIHKNAAARKKSRLATRLNALATSAS
jgi:small subunit ribosomal protein S20